MTPVKLETKFNLRELIDELEGNMKKKTTINKAIVLLKKATKQLSKTPTNVEAQQAFQQNLNKLFKKCLQEISGEDGHNPEQALSSAMLIIKIDSILTKEFPKEKLIQILQFLLTDKKINKDLIAHFGDYTNHPDIFSNVWKALLPISTKIKSANEYFLHNFLDLIYLLKFSKEVEEEVKFTAIEKRCFDYVNLRKTVNKVWGNVMYAKHSEETVKKTLIVLLERILSHLDSPILLTDFLMESLEVKGTVALLALQGIFILIQKHNLAFPDIYNRVYAMFTLEIFKLDYKARLFQLADIFLTSTHLPESLVAAFAKRLSRLALAAPAPDIIVICRFIGNLIIRHPGLSILVRRETGGIASSDPYMMEEVDPIKSRALESQLWEIHSLQKHCIPAVAKAASKIYKTLPEIEWDIIEALEMDHDSMFETEVNKMLGSSKKVRIAEKAPESLFTDADLELFDFR